MSMITKCPSCGTTFRVTPQQLQAQRGQVRCGRCATVFDGFKTLATLRDESPLDPAPAAPAAVCSESEPVKAPPQQLHEVKQAPLDLTPDAALQFDAVAPPSPPTVNSAPVVPVSPLPVAVSAPVAPVPPAVLPEPAAPALPQSLTSEPIMPAPPPVTVMSAPLPPLADAPEPATPALPPPLKFAPIVPVPPPAEVMPEPTAQEQVQPVALPESQPVFSAEPFDAAPLPRRHNGAWAFGILILIIALAAQGMYFFRGEIAARVPELRPHLNKICELLRCTVAVPQSPRQISIEASDMQATDPANPGQIALTATLRNQAANVLGYPALDVVLTNVKEHTVARRIFLPADYLDAGKDPRVGIQPNAEVTVRLNLETGDLGAAGFRLDLLAAPVH